MYKIIGGDQKEYGPVSAEELRRWIVEGRADGRTLVQAEGSTEWKPLSAFPELASAIAAMAPPPLIPSASAGPGSLAEVVLAREPEFDIGHCFGRGWSLVQENFGLLFGATFLIWLLDFAAHVIPFAHLFLVGPLFGGLYLVYLKRIRGQPASVGDAFSGFGPGFLQLLLAGFLTIFLAQLGYFFCILPGIFLQIIWIFSVPLVADKRLEFWSAMELSRQVVMRIWFKVFGLVLVAFAPFLVASAYLSIKIAYMVFSMISFGGAAAVPDFSKLMEIVTKTSSLSLIVQVVLLLNLPIAVAALMYAYEDLFGARTAPTA